jgi:hypothetical protein
MTASGDELVQLIRTRVSLAIDRQHEQLRRRIGEIRADWAGRGFSLPSGGMFSDICDAYNKAAAERADFTSAAMREVVSRAGGGSSPTLASALRAYVEAMSFQDLIAGAEADCRPPMQNPAMAAEIHRGVLTGVRAAERAIRTELDLLLLEERGKIAPTAPRAKQDKFGILDAPQLFSTDIEEPIGPLGCAVIYLDLDNFKALNTSLNSMRNFTSQTALTSAELYCPFFMRR